MENGRWVVVERFRWKKGRIERVEEISQSVVRSVNQSSVCSGGGEFECRLRC